MIISFLLLSTAEYQLEFVWKYDVKFSLISKYSRNIQDYVILLTTRLIKRCFCFWRWHDLYLRHFPTKIHRQKFVKRKIFFSHDDDCSFLDCNTKGSNLMFIWSWRVLSAPTGPFQALYSLEVRALLGFMSFWAKCCIRLECMDGYLLDCYDF